MHCFRAFYEAKTRGEFEKKEAPAEKPAYWNNSPKHSESEQGANPFLEMKKDVKKQKEVQVNFVKYPLLTSRNSNFATKKNIFHRKCDDKRTCGYREISVSLQKFCSKHSNKNSS